MTSCDVEVMVVCHQGYSASLVGASLVDIGMRRAGDVSGGFQAWRATGVPVRQRPDDTRRPA